MSTALITGASARLGQTFADRLQANLISAFHTFTVFVAYLRADKRPGAVVLFSSATARQYPLPGIGSADQLPGLMAWLLSLAAARLAGQVSSLEDGFSAIRPSVK